MLEKDVLIKYRIIYSMLKIVINVYINQDDNIVKINNLSLGIIECLKLKSKEWEKIDKGTLKKLIK